jgi:hypothetical protein
MDTSAFNKPPTHRSGLAKMKLHTLEKVAFAVAAIIWLVMVIGVIVRHL